VKLFRGSSRSSRVLDDDNQRRKKLNHTIAHCHCSFDTICRLSRTGYLIVEIAENRSSCRRIDYFRPLSVFSFEIQICAPSAEAHPPGAIHQNRAVCVHRPDVRAVPRRESFNPAVFVEDESLTVTTKYLATSGVFTSRGPAGGQAPRRRPRRRVSL